MKPSDGHQYSRSNTHVCRAELSSLETWSGRKSGGIARPSFDNKLGASVARHEGPKFEAQSVGFCSQNAAQRCLNKQKYDWLSDQQQLGFLFILGCGK